MCITKIPKYLKMIENCYPHQAYLYFRGHFEDSHLEIKLKEKSIGKQNATGDKRQVKGKRLLFLSVSWSI